MATQFLEAVKKGDRAAVDRMLDADPSLASAKDASGTSAVLLAHYHGKADVAAALLLRSPALDIFEAATVGDTKRVTALVDADPTLANAVAHDGYSPLGLASFFKRRDTVKTLLERGARPNVPSRDQGFTPLHSAVATDAAASESALVRMLLEAGADPNPKSRSGETPLHAAAFTGDLEVAELLLTYGADPNATDAKSLTPLDIARDRRNTEVAALLHRAAANRSASSGAPARATAAEADTLRPARTSRPGRCQAGSRRARPSPERACDPADSRWSSRRRRSAYTRPKSRTCPAPFASCTRRRRTFPARRRLGGTSPGSRSAAFRRCRSGSCP